MIAEPMVAAIARGAERLTYPLLVSPLPRGVQAIVAAGRLTASLRHRGGPVLTTMPIANLHARQALEELCPDGIDGIIAGKGLGRMAGQPSFTFHCLDYVLDPERPAVLRHNDLEQWFYAACRTSDLARLHIRLVPYRWARSEVELFAAQAWAIRLGADAALVRPPASPYVPGRRSSRGAIAHRLAIFSVPK